MASFEVVAMALAPPDHLARFVRYYVARGAARVTIYFDGVPERPAPEVDGYTLVICDAAFWKTVCGTRPAAVEDRQRALYRHHYAQVSADWLLVVDLDEFVFGRSDLGAVLAALPEGADALRVGSAEAVFTTAEDLSRPFAACHFRLPYSKYAAPIAARLLYGRKARFFIRGLLGHAIGKQFIRAGLQGIKIDIHHITRDGRLVEPHHAQDHAPGLRLAHFDAVDLGQWREKWDRRLAARDTVEMGKKRVDQQALYAEARDIGPAAQTALFRSYYCLSRWQRAVLRASGKLVREDLGLAGEAAAGLEGQGRALVG